MSRATVTLNSRDRREQAARWCMNAPDGTRITFAEAKRSDAQNRLMWDLLTDVARQVPWHGVRLSADDWKIIFMSALNQEMRLVPNLDGTGFINLGRSSSKLSKKEMTDLLELILKFCAERGVAVLGEAEDRGAGRLASRREPLALPAPGKAVAA